MRIQEAVVIILLTVSLVGFASANWDTDEYVYSTGGVHYLSDKVTQDGKSLSVFGKSSGIYQESAAGAQYVTGPGMSELTTTSAQANDYTSNSDLRYNGGGAAWDSQSTKSRTPNDSELSCTASSVAYSGTEVVSGAEPNQVDTDTMIGAQGPNGRYTVDKLASSDASSISGAFEGRGMYHTDFSVTGEAGHDKDSNTLQHTESAQKHLFASSNLTGGTSASTTYNVDLLKFGDPFNLTNSSCDSNETLNISEVVNTT